MKPGDVFLFYQHARLGDGDWLNSVGRDVGRDVGSKTT